MTKVKRYKVGYYTDEWGMSSSTPCLVPDDSGYAVKFEDYCKLEAENERLERNLSTTEQTMREYQELAAKRLEEIAKYRDAPVVAWVEVVDSYEGPYHLNGEKLLNVGKHKLIVKPEVTK